MNKEYVEMNEYQKEILTKKSKEMLRKEFEYIGIDNYKKYNQSIKDKEILNALIILLDAKLEKNKFNVIILLRILIQRILTDFSYMERKKLI